MTALASRGQLRASLLRWSLFTVPACVLLGFLSGYLFQSGPENPWFAILEKPAIYPPPSLFGIVWTILYVMMGFALAMVCAAWGAKGRTLAIVLFAVQFALNLAWTPVFFGAQEIGGALIVIAALDLALIATIAAFWRVRRLAAVLLLPYLAWALFATLLNWQFLQMNPDYAAPTPSNAAQRIEF